MEKNKQWKNFIQLVKKEVVPALGCTEPISLALAAARAASLLDGPVERIEARVSANLMKNGMGVTVPGTETTGLLIAAAVGALGGDPDGALEVLRSLTPQQVSEGKRLLAENRVTLGIASAANVLYAEAKVFSGRDWALAAIADTHTNLVRLEKNGQVLLDQSQTPAAHDEAGDDARSLLAGCCLQDIYDFAANAPLEEIDFIHDAANLNLCLSNEGIQKDFGLHIGATMQRQIKAGLLPDSLFTQVILRTTAASDARMGGAALPAMTNSGSGNQGITASVPVWRYGVQTGRDRETILRAVCLSDLITIHQKTGIGRLSAYCGAVSAGVGAGCGIAWLRGADYEGICHTITNAAAMISGCICDGAKASCASKIAMGVETGILGYNMYLRGNSFRPGDGIVGRDVEETIRNVGILASQGMKETDRVILKIMTE